MSAVLIDITTMVQPEILTAKVGVFFYNQAFLVLNETFTPAVMFPFFSHFRQFKGLLVLFFAQFNSVLMTRNLDLSY